MKAAPAAMFTAGACGALAAVGGREGNSSEVFTAFADCSACALGLSDYRGLRILPVLYSSCFEHDAASFTQRLRAEGITAAAVAEVRAQM